MKSRFYTYLQIREAETEGVWVLTKGLIYQSELLDDIIHVPKGFYTDLASVPRIPIIYSLWGARAHHEAVLHDYLYRIDSRPNVNFDTANQVFYEAMKCRDKPCHIRYPMFYGVCIGGLPNYHKKYVGDKL